MRVVKKVTIKLTNYEKEFFNEIQNFIVELWNDYSYQDGDTTSEVEIFLNSIKAIDTAIDNIFSCIEDEESDE